MCQEQNPERQTKVTRIITSTTNEKRIATNKYGMRRYWIDNLRWVTVLLVLLYHVIYFYNNKGVFGGVGGFDDG